MFHILSWKEIESEPYFNSLKKEISKILAGFSIIHFSCMYITNNIVRSVRKKSALVKKYSKLETI